MLLLILFADNFTILMLHVMTGLINISFQCILRAPELPDYEDENRHAASNRILWFTSNLTN